MIGAALRLIQLRLLTNYSFSSSFAALKSIDQAKINPGNLDYMAWLANMTTEIFNFKY
jgi:hypothetical protein